MDSDGIRESIHQVCHSSIFVSSVYIRAHHPKNTQILSKLSLWLKIWNRHSRPSIKHVLGVLEGFCMFDEKKLSFFYQKKAVFYYPRRNPPPGLVKDQISFRVIWDLLSPKLLSQIKCYEITHFCPKISGFQIQWHEKITNMRCTSNIKKTQNSRNLHIHFRAFKPFMHPRSIDAFWLQQFTATT